MQPECTTLREKLPYIIQRLRFSATDRGSLQSAYWLSGDEVMCALTLLCVPCSLWYHRDALRIHPHLSDNQLILMQTTPECQLPHPYHSRRS